MNLHPPEEHQLLVFWVSLLVLVATARLFGRIVQRFGQPAVVGELGAGVVLGPSILGRIAPDVTDWLFPADDVQTAMLFTVGWIGVLFLLVSTGYETDLGLLRRLGFAATAVSTGSLLVPLLTGIGLGLIMPALFMGDDSDGLVFGLFMGAALSISSLPVIAKILSEMGLVRRNFGQLTLAAGMANDVVGWILLGVIAGIASAGGVEIGATVTTLAGVAAFFALAFTLGQRALDRALRAARANGAATSAVATVVIAVLAAGSITQWLGVEAVLGAFVVGILLGRSRFRDDKTIHGLETLTNTFFAPVFFATAGLRVDLGLLSDPTVLAWTLAVIAVASLSKFFGALFGARIARLANREAFALGVGLNARGALEIVIATVGLSLGVLNETSYTVVVVMALATSIMAPPLLRATLRGWSGNSDEQKRLEREEMLASNVLVKNRRVLVPSSGGLNSVMAAQVVELAWPSDAGVTVLHVANNGETADLAVMSNLFSDRDLQISTTTGKVADAILAESRLGYGAIVLGADGEDGDSYLLSPLVDELIARSTIPVVVIRRGSIVDTRLPWAFGRALVGVAGTTSSRASQEIAFNLSANLGTELVLAHVVNQSRHVDGVTGSAASVGVGRPRRPGAVQTGTSVLRRGDPSALGRRLLDDAIDRSGRHGARSISTVERHDAVGPALVDLAAVHSTDLVVLGAHRRAMSDEFFLGHTVEEVLTRSAETVVIVVLPTDGTEGST